MGRQIEPEVHWYEGMFLRPHHFQALGRQIESRAAHGLLATHVYAWGVRHLEIAETAIENYEFAVRSAEIVFPDGTLLNVPENADIASRSFKAALDQARGPVLVHVGISEARERVADSAGEPASGPATDHRARYTLATARSADENSGANEHEIQLRRLKARLFFGDEDRAGYACLPLASIERRSIDEPVPVLSRDFGPPAVTIGADRRLLEFLHEIDQALTTKGRALGSQIQGKSITFSSDTGGDPEAIFKLQVINGTMLPFRQIVKTARIHPYDAFLILLQLIGELAIFAPERVPKDLPLYEHDNPVPGFRAASAEIHRLLNAIVPTTFARRPFEKSLKVPGAMVVKLEPSWLGRDSEFYIGIECGDGEGYVQPKVSALKLGSPPDLETIAKNRLPGIPFKRVARVPVELPTRADYFYHLCDRKSAFFGSVEATLELALIGQPLEDGKLRFWLFVVPR